MNSPQVQNSSSFQRRLTAYSTLAAAGACAVAAAPHNTEASIVYSGPVNIAVPATATGGFINLVTFAVGTSYAAVNGGNAAAPALNLWGTSASRAWLYPTSSGVNRFVSDASNNPLELSAGASIGLTSIYGTTTEPNSLTPSGGSGVWTGGTTGYLGFRFLNGSLVEYGWAQIFVPVGAPTSTNPIRLLGLAFENTGLGILAGQTSTSAVPENGNTLALLAAGCVASGAFAWRRRKAA